MTRLTRRPSSFLTCAIAGILGVPASTPGAPPRFAVVANPPSQVPGGIVASHGRGLSADGATMVGYIVDQATLWDEGFTWTHDGGMVLLGRLPGAASLTSLAFACSADGSRICGQSSSSTGSEAVYWTGRNQAHSIGDLPGGPVSGIANDISGNGEVLVGWSRTEPTWEAFRWSAAGGMTPLIGPSGPGTASYARAVSADGAVTVGQAFASGVPQACRWSGGVPQALGGLPGWLALSDAYDTSADGNVVVGWAAHGSGLPTQGEAFRWTAPTGMVGLGDLPGGSDLSWALAVSADGSVVAGYSGSAAAPQSAEAFIWTQAEGMRSIAEVAAGVYGIDLDGWRLADARGVSPDGRTFTGTAVRALPPGSPSEYDVRAYVLRLEHACPADCNEDGALTIADFVCFQSRFVALQPYSDCNGDGEHTIADFPCFQSAFVAGCP